MGARARRPKTAGFSGAPPGVVPPATLPVPDDATVVVATAEEGLVTV